MMFDMSICIQGVKITVILRNPDTHPDNMFRACLCGEQTEDTSAASHIKNGLALEQMGIVHDGGAIGPRPDGVLEHLFVNA